MRRSVDPYLRNLWFRRELNDRGSGRLFSENGTYMRSILEDLRPQKMRYIDNNKFCLCQDFDLSHSRSALITLQQVAGFKSQIPNRLKHTLHIHRTVNRMKNGGARVFGFGFRS